MELSQQTPLSWGRGEGATEASWGSSPLWSSPFPGLYGDTQAPLVKDPVPTCLGWGEPGKLPQRAHQLPRTLATEWGTDTSPPPGQSADAPGKPRRLLIDHQPLPGCGLRPANACQTKGQDPVCPWDYNDAPIDSNWAPWSNGSLQRLFLHWLPRQSSPSRTSARWQSPDACDIHYLNKLLVLSNLLLPHPGPLWPPSQTSTPGTRKRQPLTWNNSQLWKLP